MQIGESLKTFTNLKHHAVRSSDNKMISFNEWKGYYYTLEKDEPVYIFQEVSGYRKKGETVMFQGKSLTSGQYLYC